MDARALRRHAARGRARRRRCGRGAGPVRRFVRARAPARRKPRRAGGTRATRATARRSSPSITQPAGPAGSTVPTGSAVSPSAPGSASGPREGASPASTCADPGGNNLHGTIPPELGTLARLEDLRLSRKLGAAGRVDDRGPRWPVAGDYRRWSPATPRASPSRAERSRACSAQAGSGRVGPYHLHGAIHHLGAVLDRHGADRHGAACGPG